MQSQYVTGLVETVRDMVEEMSNNGFEPHGKLLNGDAGQLLHLRIETMNAEVLGWELETRPEGRILEHGVIMRDSGDVLLFSPNLAS